MARNTIPKGKLVRRFGENLFGNPKYDKLLQRKPGAPGKAQSDRKKKKLSDYGKSLMEKQKFRFSYGLSEKQMGRAYEQATHKEGDTGLNLIRVAELRLDNVLSRSNFASTTAQARQLVSHSHLKINGKKNNIPSYVLKKDDVISVKETSKELFSKFISENDHKLNPDWLEIDKEKQQIKLARFPERDEVRFMGQEQLIVEFYSR